MNIKSNGNATPDQIASMQNRFSVDLPDDYKEFLKKTNGGICSLNEQNNIFVKQANESISVLVLYGIETNEDAASVNYWMDQYRSEIQTDMLIIGDSTANGFFVMDCGAKGAIYYWDDSYTFACSDDEQNTYRIADNFSAFVQIIGNQ
ncbi:MAG: SMI1/KNR4 family protein [Anaerofustis sp.]